MAGKTNTDKINDLIERIATLEERLDNLRGDVKKLEEKLDDHLKETKTKQWDIAKIVITAAIALMTAIVTAVITSHLSKK
jgi:predicted  nucleic acid-binding Zn-ribbon protein